MRRAWIAAGGIAGAVLLIAGGSHILGAADGKDTGRAGSSGQCPDSREDPELEALYQRDDLYNLRPTGSSTGVEPAGAWCSKPVDGQPFEPAPLSLTRQYELRQPLSDALLRKMYDQAAAASGWTSDEARRGPYELRFCKKVRGVTSSFSVRSDAEPGGSTFVLAVIAEEPAQPGCPPAHR